MCYCLGHNYHVQQQKSVRTFHTVQKSERHQDICLKLEAKSEYLIIKVMKKHKLMNRLINNPWLNFNLHQGFGALKRKCTKSNC